MNDYELIKSLAKVSHTINTTGVKYDIHDYLIESIKANNFNIQIDNNRQKLRDTIDDTSIKINNFYKDKIDNTKKDDVLNIEEDEEVKKYEITMKKIVEVITDIDSLNYIKLLLFKYLDVTNLNFCYFQ